MPTQQELLNTLSQHDVRILQRLVDLANFAVIPESDTLVNVTMEQMVAKAHSLADIHFPAWTDRTKADFGEFLVELFSLFSEKDFWYINAFANEGFLSSATLYRNVYAHGLVSGYIPNLFTGSTASFRLTFAAGAELVVPRGGVIVGVTNSTVRFTNSEEFTVPVSAGNIDVVVTLSQGIYETISTPFNGKSVRLNSAPIDKASVVQSIGALTWTQVDSFAESNNTDRHFMVIPLDETGAVEIVYGRSDYGLRPNVGDFISTSYRVGAGSIGNVLDTEAHYIQQSPTLRFIQTVDQLSDASGGEDADSLEELRHKASRHFRTQGNIINSGDLEDVLEERTDILKAFAYSWANNLYFYVIPVTGIPANSTYLDSLVADFQTSSIFMANLYGVETVYKVIGVTEFTAYTLVGYSELSMIAALEQFIQKYTDPLQDAEYGQDFDLGDFTQKAIASIAGLQNIVFTVVDGGAPANISIGTGEIMQKINLANVGITVSFLT